MQQRHVRRTHGANRESTNHDHLVPELDHIRTHQLRIDMVEHFVQRIGKRYDLGLYPPQERQAAGCFLTPSTKAVPLMTSGRSVAPFNVRHFFDALSISL